MKGVVLVLPMLLLAANCSAAEPAYDLADRLLLVPAPRELSLEGAEQPFEGWQIVAPADSRLIRLGVDEINQRITALGGTPLPAGTAPRPDRPAIFVGRWWDFNVRPLAMALGVRLTPSDPGEQGYVIRFGHDQGRPVVLLGGSDEQGALYACITFRSLIHQAGGRVVVQPAAVRDWPDFKIRNNGHLMLNLISQAQNMGQLRNAANAVKEQIDFYLRHKVNYVEALTFESLRRYLEPPAQSSPEIEQQRRKVVIEVLLYARHRGIRTRFGANVEISRYLTPEQRKAAVEREPGTAYDFAAFDAHWQNARRHAEFLHEAGGAALYVHSFDWGGYDDPERWNERSAATRAMYGNDRAWASFEQFTLYFEVLRLVVPDIELEAVVDPYHYQFLMPDFPERFQEWANYGMPRKTWFRSLSNVEEAREQQRSMTAHHRYMAQHLPKNVHVVFREAGRDVFQAVAGLYGDRALTLWIYPERTVGWKGSFCPQVRFAKTYWVPGRRDYYYVASGWNNYGDERVQRLAQQEYLWNVDQPDGSDEFAIVSRFYEDGGRNITDFQRKHLIPRITRMLYGGEAEAYRQLAEANISLAYVSDPVRTGRAGAINDNEYFEPVHKHMEEQAAALERIHSAFSLLIDKTTQPWTPFYYRYTGLAGVKAALYSTVGHCREMQASGRPGEAAALARRTLAELPALAGKCAAIRAKTDTRLTRRLPALDRFRPEQFEVELRKFASN